ncbi:preprotein translocase subunit SecG [Phenylobacterium sp. Root77]|jgi:preprotein translocase subunit SecG|uniref:preprotein translocase subunit SecG n=1 Tax=unclassified Phenylobacterium TaxID=2640670 RepID=UPI0007020BB5|nr:MULTISPECIES: preprotein translocase subunit SecG [unclassified Phenylobacterium]KQW71570.1 preprotein translocase subunit SecG [Phenylobacterium sp. Root1277]KQW94490.1 preprotein translocase subunit SecG [Phenylobacterium sp. Root1290]KRC44184.1 preprotein translocase subunit SecG [Phenylobacterium sp. Root77]
MLLGILLTIHVIVCIALIAVVLLQRSEGGALGMGGSTGGLMTARGAGDLLTRTTWILGGVFFVLSLTLTVLAGQERGASSVVDRIKVQGIDPNQLNQPTAPQPAAPSDAPAPLTAPTPQVRSPFEAPAQLPAAPQTAPAAPSNP